MTELKPCALCGGAGKYHGSCFEDGCEYVSCTRCNASTPLMYKKGESIEWWNRRMSPWHTEKPTEDGLYLVYYLNQPIPYSEEKEALYHQLLSPNNEDGYIKWVDIDGEVVFGEEDIIRWQKIEEYKEES